MLEDEIIVHKLVAGLWDKEILLDILIDSGINRSFEKADHANLKPQTVTDWWNFTLYFTHLVSYLQNDFPLS